MRSFGLLFLCRGNRRRINCGQGIYDLAGPGIAKLFSGLFLDGLGIALQGLDSLVEQLVLPLQGLNLSLEFTLFCALLGVNQKAVRSKNNVPGHQAGQDNYAASCSFASRTIEPLKTRLNKFVQCILVQLLSELLFRLHRQEQNVKLDARGTKFATWKREFGN